MKKKVIFHPRRHSKVEHESVNREYEKELSELDELRPKTRADCVNGYRPCMWASCRYNLRYEITEIGSIFDHLDDDAVVTCALDVVDANPDGMSLDKMSAVLKVTRERARQLEMIAVGNLLKKKEEVLRQSYEDSPEINRLEWNDLMRQEVTKKWQR